MAIRKLFVTKKKGMRFSFTRVGKSSEAHRLAWTVHRKKGRGAKKVSFSQVSKYL